MLSVAKGEMYTQKWGGLYAVDEESIKRDAKARKRAKNSRKLGVERT